MIYNIFTNINRWESLDHGIICCQTYCTLVLFQLHIFCCSLYSISLTKHIHYFVSHRNTDISAVTLTIAFRYRRFSLSHIYTNTLFCNSHVYCCVKIKYKLHTVWWILWQNKMKIKLSSPCVLWYIFMSHNFIVTNCVSTAAWVVAKVDAV